MSDYRLDRIGRLLLTRAAVHGPDGTNVIKLLVDTGSTYTILPTEVLEAIGCDPALRRGGDVRLVTGNGIAMAPRLSVDWLHLLGTRLEAFRVVAHTIPFSGFFDGLLGMDVLTRLNAQIDIGKGSIRSAE